jgi:hypothetical protein
MFEKFQKVLEDNWKVIVAAISGAVLGGFVFGNIINGFSFFNNKDGFGIAIDRNTTLPDSVDITGEWVYEAETVGSDITFSEDKCRKRYGTVNINQKTGSYEIHLAGTRKVKDNCQGTPDNPAKKQEVQWNSQNAVVSVDDKTMFLWLKTEDEEVSRYAYISGTIIKSANDIKPAKIQGYMYYLDDSDNKAWWRAKILFYRLGSQEAKSIEKMW